MRVLAKQKKVFNHPEKGAVIAFLTANAQSEDVGFDEIKEKVSQSLMDGHICQIALDAGYDVGP